MYRSDKQFMKNPTTASSRVYVGGISESVVSADLDDLFKAHGTILGLVLQRGFGFVQYENEEQAQTAIRKMHGTLLHGRRLNVKQAVDKSRQNPLAPAAPPPTPPSLLSMGPQNQPAGLRTLMSPGIPKGGADNSPVRHKEDVREDMDTSKNVDDGNTADVDMERSARSSDANSDTSDKRRFVARGFNRHNDRNRSREREREREHHREFDNRDMPPRDMPPRDMHPLRNVHPHFVRDEPYRPPPTFVPPPGIERPDRNDCEIIVVSKQLTDYAEFIEKRLKNIGLMVDLLYPNEDVPLGRVLANISSRGCLYAILIMPQNEEYRSLTLSILHGIPQEHRNMPIEDALMLITRNFDAYMRGDRTISGTGSNGSLTEKHSESIQMILNLLAENRQISTLQYDRLIKYLQDRRELRSEFEASEGGESKLEPETDSKQAELQSRIMNILNKSSEDAPKPVEAPTRPTGSTQLLSDPSVQKALDSLFAGEMFKSANPAF